MTIPNTHAVWRWPLSLSLALCGSFVPARARAQVPEEPPAATPAETITTAMEQPAAALPPEGADAALLTFDVLPGMPAESEGPKIDLYGFADFTYFHVVSAEKSTWSELVQPKPSFYIGHLNLYVNSTLSPEWRSLVELRFTYLPAGKETVNPDGTTTLFDATGSDPTQGGTTMSWGGVNIERAWLEYKPYALLAIRAGSWLTPFGFYNDDHGTPTILSLHRPFIIGEEPFPSRQAGLHAHGKLAVGWLDFSYDLTLSNGRGALAQFNDWDTNKAIGGRLSMDAQEFGELHLGVAAYVGRYTAARRVFSIILVDDAPALDVHVVPDVSYREVSFGGEARFRYDGLLLQSEIVMNEAAYDEGQREPLPELTSLNTFAADYRRWGYYVLAGYTLPWLNLTPFFLQEYYNYANSSILPPVVTLSGGLSVRPTPGVVLKASYMTAIFSGRGSTGVGLDPGRFIAAQAAWAF